MKLVEENAHKIKWHAQIGPDHLHIVSDIPKPPTEAVDIWKP
jgi:hypothetical protein